MSCPDSVEVVDYEAYLGRIGVEGSVAPDLDTLERLSGNHAQSIPYENLEIHLGRTMELDHGHLWSLMVEQNRGGYCFQTNLLLLGMLKAVGFDVDLLRGRVWMTSAGEVPPPAHLVLRVEIDSRPFLVDVGFGGRGLRLPIAMADGQESVQGGMTYRLREEPPFGLMLECFDNNEWQALYSVDSPVCHPVDFEHSNYFLSTSSESFFVRHRICAIATPLGETTLFDRSLRIREGNDVRTTELSDLAQLTAALRDHFGIKLGSHDTLTL